MSSIENVSKNIQFMLDYILIFTDINAKVTHHYNAIVYVERHTDSVNSSKKMIKLLYKRATYTH